MVWNTETEYRINGGGVRNVVENIKISTIKQLYLTT